MAWPYLATPYKIWQGKAHLAVIMYQQDRPCGDMQMSCKYSKHTFIVNLILLKMLKNMKMTQNDEVW